MYMHVCEEGEKREGRAYASAVQLMYSVHACIVHAWYLYCLHVHVHVCMHQALSFLPPSPPLTHCFVTPSVLNIYIYIYTCILFPSFLPSLLPSPQRISQLSLARHALPTTKRTIKELSFSTRKHSEPIQAALVQCTCTCIYGCTFSSRNSRRQTYKQTDRQTDTQTNYCNSRCACAPRGN